MKTAYLVELPRYDLSWLYERYKVKFIFQGKSPNALREDSEQLYVAVYDWAYKTWTIDDYLVLTGNLTVMVVAALAIQDAVGYTPKMLKFNSEASRYEEIFMETKVWKAG